MKTTLRWLHSFLLVLIVLATPFLIGCQTTLAPGGVYKGDTILYAAEKAITTSYKEFDNFLKFEKDYRDSLPVEVSRAADTIRLNSKKWIDSASALRDAYLSNPIPENRTKLSTALDVIQAALAESTKYIKAYQKAPLKTTSFQVEPSWSWLMPASPIALSVR